MNKQKEGIIQPRQSHLRAQSLKMGGWPGGRLAELGTRAGGQALALQRELPFQTAAHKSM